jgi:hypothetical protein
MISITSDSILEQSLVSNTSTGARIESADTAEHGKRVILVFH